ncbi:hypothetical protein IEO21_07564 [Rhodonia placenta]|uniref:Uncharacterized protein n=1 Tax=Rhodonia placenta TaxID=104341 RepID=A0A8H7TZM1_9APHY|nr:hypothetical protein IEO21_07564 [Postia placenta]
MESLPSLFLRRSPLVR